MTFRDQDGNKINIWEVIPRQIIKDPFKGIKISHEGVLKYDIPEMLIVHLSHKYDYFSARYVIDTLRIELKLSDN